MWEELNRLSYSSILPNNCNFSGGSSKSKLFSVHMNAYMYT